MMPFGSLKNVFNPVSRCQDDQRAAQRAEGQPTQVLPQRPHLRYILLRRLQDRKLIQNKDMDI